LESWQVTFAEGSVNRAISGGRLVRETRDILSNKAFFEIYARIAGDDLIPDFFWKLAIPQP
jgi:hypothetical protein